MTHTTEIGATSLVEEKLARRDWILLPMLSLMTILILVVSAELAARYFYQESESHAEKCLELLNAPKSMGGVPNSVCWEKIPEGVLERYQFNSSGYRSNTEFGPKSPGTFRIVILGSSFALGARVPIEDAMATKLSPELSQLTGKKIEILNMGLAGAAGYPPNVALRIKDALAVQPDLIILVMTPWDIQKQAENRPLDDPGILPRADASKIEKLIIQFRNHRWRALLMIRHFLYQSQSQFVKVFLPKGDVGHDSGFLNAEYDDGWKRHLQQFEIRDALIEARVKTAGVPMATVLIPLRAQAAMLSMNEWPAGYDPYKLGNDVRSIITSHGGTYLDILPEYRNIPNPEQGYYPVEGHLNARGNETVTRLLAKELTSGVVPALKATSPQVAIQEPAR
jgi:hypothetical protein